MLRIRLLGELELELDGVVLQAPSSRPARALLGWLALHPGAHRRAQLAAHLWPDVLDTSARASLRTTLHALRAALGSGGARYLLASREEVGLRGDVWVDLQAFDELVARRRARRGTRAARRRAACRLRRGLGLAGARPPSRGGRRRARAARGAGRRGRRPRRRSALDARAGRARSALRGAQPGADRAPLAGRRPLRRGRRLRAPARPHAQRAACRAVGTDARARRAAARRRGPRPSAATSAAVVALPPALDRRRRSRFVGRTRRARADRRRLRRRARRRAAPRRDRRRAGDRQEPDRARVQPLGARARRDRPVRTLPRGAAAALPAVRRGAAPVRLASCRPS